jgi:hypothetical protein
MLPLNYLLEFGLFFLIARYKWRQHRASGEPLSRGDLASAIMLTISILVCTFMRSSVIGCNDLGWRGMLIAEFVLLLLWAADLFALGFVGTVYDLAIVCRRSIGCRRIANSAGAHMRSAPRISGCAHRRPRPPRYSPIQRWSSRRR